MGYLEPEGIFDRVARTEGIGELIAMLFFYITIGKDHKFKWKVLVFASVVFVFQSFCFRLCDAYTNRKAKGTPSDWEPNEDLYAINIPRFFFYGLFECCILVINYLTIKDLIRIRFKNSSFFYGLGIVVMCMITFSLSFSIGVYRYKRDNDAKITMEHALLGWQLACLVFLIPLLCFAIYQDTHKENHENKEQFKKEESHSKFIQFFIDLWQHEEFFLIAINFVYLLWVLSEFGNHNIHYYNFMKQLRFVHQQFFLYLATSYSYYSLKALPQYLTYMGTNASKKLGRSRKDSTNTSSNNTRSKDVTSN